MELLVKETVKCSGRSTKRDLFMLRTDSVAQYVMSEVFPEI
jgi:hypothetical protein